MNPEPPAPTPASIPRWVHSRPSTLGWWIVGAVSLVAFSRVAFFNPVLGIFIEPLEDEFGWSRATIAGAISVGTLAGAAATPLLGPLVDRWGGRPFMVSGVLVLGVLLLLLSTVQSVWQFYLLFGAGRAVVTAVLDIAITVTIANWFIRSRGRAIALTLVGTRGGMAVMPLIVLVLISVSGWRAAWAALGVLVLVLGVAPAWALVRRRPEDVGLRPDGRVTPPTVEDADADPHWSVREAIHTRAFWLLLLGTAQLFLIGGAVNLTFISHLQDNGLSRNTAVTVLTLWAVMGIVGGLMAGEVRQRMPVRKALPVAILFSAGALVWLIFVNAVWMGYVFAIWHGLAFGVQLPLNQIAFPDYFGRWTVGAIRGITAPVQWGLNAVGPLLAGLVFDARGTYDPIYAVFVGLYMVGAALIFSARVPRRRDQTAPVITRST